MKKPMTDRPCLRCLKLARDGHIRKEFVQRLPEGAWAPIRKDKKGQKQCFDCAAAEALLRISPSIPGFTAARIATGNCRAESLRLPGVKTGLMLYGLMQPCEPGDLDAHYEWLDGNDWFGMEENHDA